MRRSFMSVSARRSVGAACVSESAVVARACGRAGRRGSAWAPAESRRDGLGGIFFVFGRTRGGLERLRPADHLALPSRAAEMPRELDRTSPAHVDRLAAADQGVIRVTHA